MMDERKIHCQSSPYELRPQWLQEKRLQKWTRKCEKGKVKMNIQHSTTNVQGRKKRIDNDEEPIKEKEHYLLKHVHKKNGSN
jgi:RecB family exonuclease